VVFGNVLEQSIEQAGFDWSMIRHDKVIVFRALKEHDDVASALTNNLIAEDAQRLGQLPACYITR